MKHLILTVTLLISSTAFANGNTYRSQKNYDGSITTRGYNYNTGNNWRTTTKPNGDQRGIDSNGNSWSYNKGSGTYMNYGTGKICTGKGAYRVCS